MTGDEQKAERDKKSKEILNSDSPKIVLLAGPGCGKTFTFKELLQKYKSTPDSALAITFINTLVKDLDTELSGLAEVKTFHSLAHKILRQYVSGELTKGFEVFQGNDELIKEDFKIIADTEPPDFSDLFRNLKTSDEIDFYFERCKYYDSSGHDDVVYRVLKKRMEGIIPAISYDVIVVDEFQDFNLLEVEFIEKVLEAKYKLLIAGDDDQAIYGFRLASASHIRDRVKKSDYKFYTLPFCSRCTEVIVTATNQIIDTAVKKLKLSGRIPKEFICFLPNKEKDNADFPKIIHAHCTVHTSKAPYVSKYLDKILKIISQEEINEAKAENYPPVLVIGKQHYIKTVANDLERMGYKVDIGSKEKDPLMEIKYALNLIQKNPDSNLAWRIILKCKNPTDIDQIILSTSNGTPLVNLLSEELKNKVLKVVNLIGKIAEEKELDGASQAIVSEFFETSYEEVRNSYKVKAEPETEDNDKQLTVKFVTHFGAKGLSGGRVFIIDFNEGSFPKSRNNPTDTEICQFIIDVTRTRKQCHLISNGMFGATRPIYPSSFINWIDSSHIENVNVNKEFFSH